MSRFKTRPGVVLTRIRGEHLLVSARKARGHCPYLTQINGTAAAIWKCLEGGADIDACVRALSDEYYIEDDSRVYEQVKELIGLLCKEGYLIESEKGGDAHEE